MMKETVSKQYPCKRTLQGGRPFRVPKGIAGLVPFMAAALISFSSLPANAQSIPYDEMVDLGTLRADNSGNSIVNALSADGSVAAGNAQSNTEFQRAFRWTEAGGMVDLGTLKTDNSGDSEANALSADGSVAAGWAESDTELQRAFRWTEADGMADLGTLKTDNSGGSEAYALSADGSVAAGWTESDTELQRAFRWTEADGMVDLGTLKTDNSGDSYAYALSADGSVAAGWAESDTELQRAFRWTEADGMVDLGTLKTDNSGTSYAYALSTDGSVVAGESQTDNGELHAFIYRSIMQDYDNLLASFPLLANDADVATAAQQWTLASILDQTCFAGRKGGVCLSLGGRFSYTGSDDAHDLGSRTGATGLLSLGYGVNEAFTFGATAALGLTELDHNGFDMQTGYGFGVWGEYSEEGMSRTGWQIGLAAGWGTQDTDITRGIGLDNVELVDGSSDLSTLSGRLSLGYGFRNPDDWVLTPRASVTAYRTRLDAFEETEGDFTADYDRMEVTTTTATVEVSAVKRIGNGSRLSLGAGLDYDLDADRARLEGTSTVPGLETFSVGSSLDRNDLRPFVAAAYSFRVTDSSWFTTSAGVQSPVFGSSPRIDAGLRYCVRF